MSYFLIEIQKTGLIIVLILWRIWTILIFLILQNIRIYIPHSMHFASLGTLNLYLEKCLEIHVVIVMNYIIFPNWMIHQGSW